MLHCRHFMSTRMLSTASVPLGGWIFKDTTLDAELATKLEGETLFEEIGLKDSYIVYWCQLSQLDIILRVKARDLKIHNNIPLFYNGCWGFNWFPTYCAGPQIQALQAWGLSGHNPTHQHTHLMLPLALVLHPHEPGSGLLLQLLKSALIDKSQLHTIFLPLWCRRPLRWWWFPSLVLKRLLLLCGSTWSSHHSMTSKLLNIFVPANPVLRAGTDFVLHN